MYEPRGNLISSIYRIAIRLKDKDVIQVSVNLIGV